MKKRLKLLLTLAAFVAFFCLAGVVWHLIANGEGYKPNPIRPKDFPEILIAPENAILLDHAAPSGSRSVPHTYGIHFVMDDPYPSDYTYKFIENHLSSNDWQRLNYDLLNPYSPAPQVCAVPERLDPETVNMLFPKRKQKGNYPCTWRKEDWVKDNEHIGVILYYAADLATKEVCRDKVYVDLNLFERESWIRPCILRYKELHPKEFSKDVEPEQEN